MRELHRRRQTVAALRNRLDDPVGGAIVAKVLAQLGDAVRERLIGDDDVAPDLFVERIARDDLAGALRQAHQHVHHPRLDAHVGIAAHDAILARLDQTVAETKPGFQLLACESHLNATLNGYRAALA